MPDQPEFGHYELFRHIIGDVALVISERDGESTQRQQERRQGMVHSILAFQPRDGIEAILATRCVMFHELSIDSLRRTLKGEEESSHRSTRANIVALDRAFGANLTRLQRYQARDSDAGIEQPACPAIWQQEAVPAPPANPATSMDLGNTDAGPGSARESAPAQLSPAEATTPADPSEAATADDTDAPAALVLARALTGSASDLPPPPWALPAAGSGGRVPESSDFPVSQQKVEACLANPLAIAALESNDPGAFARAMGVEPTEAFLAAANAEGSPFTRKWQADLRHLMESKRKADSPELEPV